MMEQGSFLFFLRVKIRNIRQIPFSSDEFYRFSNLILIIPFLARSTLVSVCKGRNSLPILHECQSHCNFRETRVCVFFLTNFSCYRPLPFGQSMFALTVFCLESRISYSIVFGGSRIDSAPPMLETVQFFFLRIAFLVGTKRR